MTKVKTLTSEAEVDLSDHIIIFAPTRTGMCGVPDDPKRIQRWQHARRMALPVAFLTAFSIGMLFSLYARFSSSNAPSHLELSSMAESLGIAWPGFVGGAIMTAMIYFFAKRYSKGLSPHYEAALIMRSTVSSCAGFFLAVVAHWTWSQYILESLGIVEACCLMWLTTAAAGMPFIA